MGNLKGNASGEAAANKGRKQRAKQPDVISGVEQDDISDEVAQLDPELQDVFKVLCSLKAEGRVFKLGSRDQDGNEVLRSGRVEQIGVATMTHPSTGVDLQGIIVALEGYPVNNPAFIWKQNDELGVTFNLRLGPTTEEVQ